MTKKGERFGGRTKGTKNRATIEREDKARLDQARLAEIERLQKAESASLQVAVAQTAGVRLAKDVLEDFMAIFVAMAMPVRPLPAGVPPIPGHKENLAEFEKWAALATDVAKALAPYQSPRLAALVVGAAVINDIKISGGLPDDQDGGLADEPVKTIEGEVLPPKLVNDG